MRTSENADDGLLLFIVVYCYLLFIDVMTIVDCRVVQRSNPKFVIGVALSIRGGSLLDSLMTKKLLLFFLPLLLLENVIRIFQTFETWKMPLHQPNLKKK